MIKKMSRFSKIGAGIAAVFIIVIVVTSLFSPSEETIKLDFDNFSIDTVTEEQKLKVVDSMGGWFVSEGKSGQKSGIKDLEYRDFDSDRASYSASNARGLKTLSATLAKDCVLSFSIDAVSEGEAIIIVIIDNEIVDEFDFEEKNSLKYEIEGEKTVYIKILADNAKVDITVERSFS